MLSFNWQLNFSPQDQSDEIALAVVSHGTAVLVLTALLSLPMLYWLHALMRRRRAGDT
jgi:hypothetical protein